MLLVKSSVQNSDKSSKIQACVDKTEVEKFRATPSEFLGKKHPITELRTMLFPLLIMS